MFFSCTRLHEVGATTCPEESTTLYEGFMGAAYYTHTGSGYNFLCMHPEPEWPEGMRDGRNVGPGNNAGATVYGVEYKDTGSMDKNHLHDAACAVCQLKSEVCCRTCSGAARPAPTITS